MMCPFFMGIYQRAPYTEGGCLLLAKEIDVVHAVIRVAGGEHEGVAACRQIQVEPLSVGRIVQTGGNAGLFDRNRNCKEIVLRELISQ